MLPEINLYQMFYSMVISFFKEEPLTAIILTIEILILIGFKIYREFTKDKTIDRDLKKIEDSALDLAKVIKGYRETNHHIKVNKTNNYFANIEFNEFSGLLVLNMFSNKYLLSTLKTNGDPLKIFSYLFDNPNKKILITDLEKTLRIPKKKNYSSLFAKLKFKGELRKLFIDINKESLTFRNNITSLEASELNIDKGWLKKELKDFNKIN